MRYTQRCIIFRLHLHCSINGNFRHCKRWQIWCITVHTTWTRKQAYFLLLEVMEVFNTPSRSANFIGFSSSSTSVDVDETSHFWPNRWKTEFCGQNICMTKCNDSFEILTIRIYLMYHETQPFPTLLLQSPNAIFDSIKEADPRLQMVLYW